MLNAKNGTILIGDTTMDYISFGHGPRTLVMIPGVGDGIMTVKGKAMLGAIMYRLYSRFFKVYMFSRKNALPEGCTTRMMAQDQADAMRALGIRNACIMGVSQGGMIAQYLAMDAPELVRKLILVVTAPCASAQMKDSAVYWNDLAEQHNYKELMIDITERSYTEALLRHYRKTYPLLSVCGKPKSFQRFKVQLNSCVEHNALQEIHRIACPTLIIGGENDQVLGPEGSHLLAQHIPDNHLLMYPEYGHGLYMEARDFHHQVIRFFIGKHHPAESKL